MFFFVVVIVKLFFKKNKLFYAKNFAKVERPFFDPAVELLSAYCTPTTQSGQEGSTTYFWRFPSLMVRQATSLGYDSVRRFHVLYEANDEFTHFVCYVVTVRLARTRSNSLELNPWACLSTF
jgi:hypothetical protein